MADPSELLEIDRRIAVIRENIRGLTEQATAFSGAADEARISERIAEQEALLDVLQKERDALAG